MSDGGDGSDYGYCAKCKMELNHRDQRHGPPEICEGCFVLEMNDDYDRYPDDYRQISIKELLSISAITMQARWN